MNAPGAEQAPRPAGRARRLLAALIDFVATGMAGLVLVLATGAFHDAEDYAGDPLPRIVALGFATYFILNAYPLWRRSQSIGKLVLGLEVVRIGTGKRAALWQLVLRSPFFLALYAVFLGWLAVLPVVDTLAILHRKRRCLHDWVCRTDVVMRVR